MTNITKSISIDLLMGIESIRTCTFAGDSEKILFLSTISGPVEASSIAISGPKTGLRCREILTEHSLTNAQLLSDGRAIFELDPAGSELTSIFLRLHGKDIRLSAEDAKSAIIKVDRAERWLYFLDNKRDPCAFDAKRVSLENPEYVELVFENKDDLVVEDVSDNGRYLALSRKVRGRQKETFVFDRGTRTSIPAGDLQSLGGEIDPRAVLSSDDRLFVKSWKDRETAAIFSVDQTGRSEIIHQTTWDIEMFQVSAEGRFHAFVVNENSRFVLQVYNTRTNTYFDLGQLKDLHVRSLAFAPDEKHLAFIASSSDRPNDIFTLCLEDGSIKQWTDSGARLRAQAPFIRSRSVSFESFDGLSIPAIFYEPAPTSEPVPAVVITHGGPGGQCLDQWDSVRQCLVQNGIAVLCVNNRGSSGYGKSFWNADKRRHGRDDLDDCVYGIEFLRSTGRVDHTRVAIMGGSYGGFLTMAALCFRPKAFRCGVNIVGVTNWLRTLKSLPPWWTDFKKDMYDYMGDPFTEEAYLASISPLFHAHQIERPFLVLQGANDPRVLQSESDDIVAAAQANGIDVEYVLFANEGHGFTRKENQLQANKAIVNFLQKNLFVAG